MTKEQFLEFKQKNPLDSIAAAQLRDKAFDSFVQDGWPTKKDEAWKYTSLSHMKNASLVIPSVTQTLNHEEMKWIAGQLDRKYLNIVFTNGFFNRTLSDEVEDFFEIAELTDKDFASTAETEGKVISIARAFSYQKYAFNINRQNQTSQIIQISFFQTGSQAEYVNPMMHIHLNENASAKIILNYQSRAGGSHLVNSDVYIKMDRKTNLQFLQIQNEEATDTHLSRVIFNLDDYANLTSLDLALGGILSRHYMQVNFNGEYAVAGAYGVVALGQKQHSDHYTFINHTKGHNVSTQKYKSILADQSNSIFRGRIRIEQDAQKAVSEQLNNSLMLSREAQVSSIPQLEIYADDVKAGHGSTVGQLNKEEMFYFLSRGIDQIQATKMMSYGFVLEMTAVFEDEALQAKVSTMLDQKLNGMFV